MKDIGIYKTKNNGLGGSFDLTNSSTIFTTKDDINYCCIYVVNEGSVKKRVLNISSVNLDNVELCVLEDESGVLLNTLTIENELPELDYYSFDRFFNDLVLDVNDFFTVLLRLENLDNNISKRSINISVEYVDEY